MAYKSVYQKSILPGKMQYLSPGPFPSQLDASRCASSLRRGFTLVELLAVIAVIVVLTSLTMPAMRTMLQSRGRAAAIAELRGGLELARSRAMAEKSYVWLAIMNTTRQGRDGVSFSLFLSRDGTASTALTNVAPIVPPRFLPDVKIVPQTELDEQTQALIPSDAVGIVGQTVRFPAKNGVTDYESTTESYTLTLTPGGEVLMALQPTPSTPYEPHLVLPLKLVNESEPGAALLLEGGSGHVKRLEL